MDQQAAGCRRIFRQVGPPIGELEVLQVGIGLIEFLQFDLAATVRRPGLFVKDDPAIDHNDLIGLPTALAKSFTTRTFSSKSLYEIAATVLVIRFMKVTFNAAVIM